MNVLVVGAGKVGRALTLAARAAGLHVTLRAGRKGPPPRAQARAAELVVFALRDPELAAQLPTWVERGLLGRGQAAVHCAGSKSAELLAPLRALGVAVAQMHPMISFASTSAPPSLDAGHVHVAGDARAVARARRFAKRLGMTPRTFPGLDPVLYHAAAALVANGAAALAAEGARVLAAAGATPDDIPAMLGPLVRSVGDNVAALGFPGALTGPVRRGEPRSVEAHRALLEARVPEALGLYDAAVLAQVPLGRALGEAPAEAFDAIEALARRGLADAGNASKSSKSKKLEPASPPARSRPRRGAARAT